MTTRLAALAIGLLLVCEIPCAADAGPRHGVVADLQSFPQATPKDTLGSVIKAADLKRFDYVLAHLADPEWVDERIKLSEGGFADLVKETAVKLDAASLKQLKKFLQDGTFETIDVTTVVRLDSGSDRVVRLLKIKDRWYLRNTHKR